MRKLNVKLALILLGATVLLAGGVFLVHSLQAWRIANAFLWQARRAEEEDRPDQVAKFLRRYLEFRPHDLDERAHLGQVLAGDRLAVSPRARENALFVLEPVIARAPDRLDLHRLVVRLAMALTPPRLDKAKEHLDVLVQALPDDGEIAHYLGAYYEADKKDPQGLEKAVEWYGRAVAKAPDRVATYVRLAALLRDRLRQADRADQVMDDLVRANDQSFRAYLSRGRYHLKYGAPEKAGQDLKRAHGLAPEEAEVLLASAELAAVRRDWDGARVDLKHGLERFPHDGRFYLALSRVEIQAGQPADAERVLEKGVKALSGPGLADLLWHLANLYCDHGRHAKAEEVLAQMSKAGSSPTAVQYLQARVLLGKEDWGPAARLLERARLVLTTAPEANRELLIQVDLLLGQCYDRLNEPTRQLEAFQRVVEADPKSERGRLGMAASLRALGRTREALQQQQLTTDQPQAAPQRWIEVARLRMELLLQSGEGEWNEVEAALRQADKAWKALPNASDDRPEAAELVILRAQILAAQEKLADARQLLATAWQAQPQKIVFGVGLSEIEQRQSHWPEAWSLLDQVEQRAGGSTVEVRLARARYWANRRGPEAGPAVGKLAEGLEQLPPDEQATLLRGLGEAALHLGQVQEAGRFWGRLAELPRGQKDLRLRLQLFDLALQAGDDERMQQAVRAIQALEGSQGALARYGTALRLIWRAGKHRDQRALDEARGLLDQVATQRPGWPAVPLARAEVDKLQGNIDQAIQDYQSAWSLGEHSPRVVRPLVQLLLQSQRYAEADQWLQKLPRSALAGDLGRLYVEVLVHTDPSRAVPFALKEVKPDSNDYRDFLWVGQVLAAGGRSPKEAEQQLRRAVELGGTHAETWVALVQLLVNQSRQSEALALLEQAQAKLPPEQAPLALGLCHEALGHPEQAQKYFQAALTARPDHGLVLRQVAGYYLRTLRPREAEPLLRKLMAGQVQVSPGDVRWARRGLAMVLVAAGRYPQLSEALSLVGLRLDDTGQLVEEQPLAAQESTEEQRARVRVLAASRLPALRLRAIEMLEQLRGRQALTADDQYLMVQLCEAAGSWSKASDHLRVLLKTQGHKPLYLAHYAQSLLQQKQFEEAHAAIAQLEKWEKDHQAAPGALGTVELKVLAYRLQGQPDKAVAVLKAHVSRDGARPEELLSLIGLYGRLHRLPEALDLCEQCWKTCPPALASGTSLAVLRGGHPTPEQLARVERWLQGALAKERSPALLLQLADLQDQRGHYKEAEALYQEVLKREPENVVAMNNLAWLLALKSGEGREDLTRRALELYGPRPELLDTSAVVYLALKQPEKAIAALEKAANLDNPTGTRYFHLARAYQMANNSAEAAKAFRKAKELGLKRASLHPVEQTAWGEMFDALDHE